MKSFSNTKRVSKLRNAEHEQVLYTILARASICKLVNTTNPMRGQCIQQMRPWKHDWEVYIALATTKLEREVYTTLATTKTRAGSVYNTCYHDNLRRQRMQHLQKRKLERAVHTTPANMKTWASSAYSSCKHEHLRAVHTAPANTKTWARSAYSTCKHENMSEQHLLKERTRTCSYDCTKGFIKGFIIKLRNDQLQQRRRTPQ